MVSIVSRDLLLKIFKHSLKIYEGKPILSGFIFGIIILEKSANIL